MWTLKTHEASFQSISTEEHDPYQTDFSNVMEFCRMFSCYVRYKLGMHKNGLFSLRHSKASIWEQIMRHDKRTKNCSVDPILFTVITIHNITAYFCSALKCTNIHFDKKSFFINQCFKKWILGPCLCTILTAWLVSKLLCKAKKNILEDGTENWLFKLVLSSQLHIEYLILMLVQWNYII
jgi:hypothetical protein